MRYLNHYRCDECDVSWDDEWDCCCDDECPNCGRDFSPYESEDLNDDNTPLVVASTPCGGVQTGDLEMTAYGNDEGETFYRENDTYGHTGEYDVSRDTKKELDDWLAKNGFRVIGYENPEN